MNAIFYIFFLHCPLAGIDNISVAPFVEGHFAAFTGETLKYCFEQISISSKKIIAVDYNVEGRRLRHCVRDAPPPKKRENVGIFKKQGGGSTPIPLPFFTVFNMGDPP